MIWLRGQNVVFLMISLVSLEIIQSFHESFTIICHCEDTSSVIEIDYVVMVYKLEFKISVNSLVGQMLKAQIVRLFENQNCHGKLGVSKSALCNKLTVESLIINKFLFL